MIGGAPTLKIKLQIYCGDEIAMGPGKADLLDAITREGSISAAGRAMGMSYRRAWLLVDVMNRCWCEPLVTTSMGRSPRGGSAKLTPFGSEILAGYRAIQAQATQIRYHGTWTGLEARLLARPLEQQRHSKVQAHLHSSGLID